MNVLSQDISQVERSILFDRIGTIVPKPPVYVVHTSSLPLATTIDYQFLLGSNPDERYVCGHSRDETFPLEKGHCCARRSCMVKDSQGNRFEYLRSNCPCRQLTRTDDLTGEQLPLIPLCALNYIRCIGKTPCDEEFHSGPERKIKPDEILFCTNAENILNSKYSYELRMQTLCTGWQWVDTTEKLDSALRCLYWYRKYETHLSLGKLLVAKDERNFKILKRALTQTLHTVNSILVKKLLAFGSETGDYVAIARQTAMLFKELLVEYLQEPIRGLDGRYVEPTNTTYNIYKEFCGVAKMCFSGDNASARSEVLHFDFKGSALGSMFGRELKALAGTIDKELSTANNDYTNSLNFKDRMTILSQTRGMGYLPQAQAVVRQQNFREQVNRPVEKIDEEHALIIRQSIMRRLGESGVPKDILEHTDTPYRGVNHVGIEVGDLRKEIYAYANLEIKPSASVETFVKDGGRMEDARELFQLAKTNDWDIPIRSITDGHIIDYLKMCEISRDEDIHLQIPRIVFWISFQLMINHWISKGEWDESFKHDFMIDGIPYCPGVMDARIVHISEPGKERNLTASSSIYTWVLTPGAKTIQAVLALNKEHHAGLLGSLHAWRHEKKISGENAYSHFLYGTRGVLKDSVESYFTDFKESTDFLIKSIGFNVMLAFMNYTAFPGFYGKLILKTIVEAQPVTEVIVRDINLDNTMEDEFINRHIIWKGSINEGFMMGNPVTKPILHLVHDVSRKVAELLLDDKGVRIGSEIPERKRNSRPSFMNRAAIRSLGTQRFY